MYYRCLSTYFYSFLLLKKNFIKSAIKMKLCHSKFNTYLSTYVTCTIQFLFSVKNFQKFSILKSVIFAYISLAIYCRSMQKCFFHMFQRNIVETCCFQYYLHFIALQFQQILNNFIDYQQVPKKYNYNYFIHNICFLLGHSRIKKVEKIPLQLSVCQDNYFNMIIFKFFINFFFFCLHSIRIL